MSKVYNRHLGNAPKDAVYIGRPSIWGNPFEIGKDGNRDEVIRKYRKWLESGESFGNPKASMERAEAILVSLDGLRGRDLECFCFPEACHGDVLVEMANAKAYPIILTVHDEIITEVPDDPAWSSDGLARLMSIVPEWAPGLPLAAAGFETKRYRK